MFSNVFVCCFCIASYQAKMLPKQFTPEPVGLETKTRCNVGLMVLKAWLLLLLHLAYVQMGRQ